MAILLSETEMTDAVGKSCRRCPCRGNDRHKRPGIGGSVRTERGPVDLVSG